MLLSEKESSNGKLLAVVRYVVAYVYMLVNLVIGVFLWFAVRDLVGAIQVTFNNNVWSYSFINYLTMILFAIAFLACILVLQHIYTKGVQKRWVPVSFLVAIGVQAGLYVLTVLLTQVFNSMPIA